MTNEEKATWIKRIFMLLLAGGVVVGVWLYPKNQPEEVALPPVPTEYDLEVVHYHLPANPESKQLAESLNNIARKYDKVVLVTRVDVLAKPELAKAAGITSPPQVVMRVGENKVFEFTGLWPQPDIERKIDEILRGLERMTKGWRPTVKGMQPATN